MLTSDIKGDLHAEAKDHGKADRDLKRNAECKCNLNRELFEKNVLTALCFIPSEEKSSFPPRKEAKEHKVENPYEDQKAIPVQSNFYLKQLQRDLVVPTHFPFTRLPRDMWGEVFSYLPNNEIVYHLLGADPLTHKLTQNKALMYIAHVSGVNMNTEDSEGMTALMIASSHNKTSIVSALIRNGALTNYQTKVHGVTALHSASITGKLEAVGLLCRAMQGRELDVKDNGGMSALIYACIGNHTAVVRLLFKEGASLDTKDCKGNTALSTACKLGHAEAVQALLELGADAETRDLAGCTPLIQACYDFSDRNRSPALHTTIIGLLLDAGADVNAQSSAGMTALMAAARLGYSETVELLLQRNADPDLVVPNSFGRTAVYEAGTPLIRNLIVEASRQNARARMEQAMMHV